MMEVENEDVIRRFLFGRMPEEERFEFEARFVSDSGLFEQISAVEDELIEKYVRGWMAPDEKVEFETIFLATEKRRERVTLAKVFLDQITRKGSSLTDTVEVSASNQNLGAAFRQWFSIPKFAVAGAMGLIVVLAGVWIFSALFAPSPQEVVFQPGNDAQVPPASTRSPQAVASVSPTSSTETADPTPNTVTNEQVPAVNSRPIPTPTFDQPSRTTVLALFPGVVRSGGSNNVLALPNNAKAATFLLNLPSTDYTTYTALVTDADGNTIAQFDKLRASKGSVRLVVSADKLKKGDYLIKLDGINRSGENESVADFQFRIDR